MHESQKRTLDGMKRILDAIDKLDPDVEISDAGVYSDPHLTLTLTAFEKMFAGQRVIRSSDALRITIDGLTWKAYHWGDKYSPPKQTEPTYVVIPSAEPIQGAKP